MAQTRLQKEEQLELKSWLAEKQIKTQNINRYFSDGVAFAQLLKPMYPKYIDMHNYNSCSSAPLKMQNWETLNFKILDKIKLRQSKEQLEGIIRATPGSIDKLLYKIMKMEKSSLKNIDEQTQEENWIKNEEIAVVSVQKKVGDTTITEKEKYILFSIYEGIIQEIAHKEILIKAEQRKLAHYDNLLRLREERIRELKSQLKKHSLPNDAKAQF